MAALDSAIMGTLRGGQVQEHAAAVPDFSGDPVRDHEDVNTIQEVYGVG